MEQTLSPHAPMPWVEAAAGLNVKCRKTIAKLVAMGHLKRVPGMRQLMIVRESYVAFVAGKTVAGIDS